MFSNNKNFLDKLTVRERELIASAMRPVKDVNGLAVTFNKTETKSVLQHEFAITNRLC